MDDEAETRGTNRGRLPYDHIFLLEPVVPVEWYSRAQLEYFAEKIRKSQSIESLLLPIPKIAMKCFVRDGAHERRETIPQHTSEPRIAMDNFSDDDLSRPLQIASPPSTSSSQSNHVADEEMEAVALTLENIVNIVVVEENDRFRAGLPASFVEVLKNTPQELRSDAVLPAKEEQVTKTPGITDLGSGENRVCQPQQFPQIDQQRRSPSFSNARAGDSASHNSHLHNSETSVKLCDEPKQEPRKRQRFLRKKVPLAVQGPGNDTAMRLHESDVGAQQLSSLQPMIRRAFEQLVVVVSSKSQSDLQHRNFHHPTTFDDSFKPRKVEPTEIEGIVSRINVAVPKRTPRLLVGCEESRSQPPVEESPEAEEHQDEEAKLKRELYDLLFEETYEDLPLSEIMDGAYVTLLLEESAEVKLLNEKKKLLALRKDLENKLKKLQNPPPSTQRDARSAENFQQPNPKKRKLIETQGPPPVVRTRIVAAAPKNLKTIDDSANPQRMALAPGTLLRVVQGKLEVNAAAQSPRFAVIPQANRASPNPTELRVASPLRKTINIALLPTFTTDPNADHFRNEAPSMRGFSQSGQPPTMVSIASNCNPSQHSLANHTRFIKVDSSCLNHNTGISPMNTGSAVQVGFPHVIGHPSHGGNDLDPPLVTGQPQPRQLIQVPSYTIPLSKPSVIQRAPNSRVVMVTPAQFSALQSQVHQRRPMIRIQHVREHTPTTLVHLPRYPDEFVTVPPATATNLKPTPVAFTEHRVTSLPSNDQTVILNPSLNFQVVRPQSTIAPRFFTVKQPYIAKPSGPPH